MVEIFQDKTENTVQQETTFDFSDAKPVPERSLPNVSGITKLTNTSITEFDLKLSEKIEFPTDEFIMNGTNSVNFDDGKSKIFELENRVYIRTHLFIQ